MSLPHGMNADVKLAEAKATAAHAFVRSLNILLKFARLYGFKHARTATQFETTWNELRAAVSADNEAGLLLGAAGQQLLLDGVPLEATPTERSFAQLLSAAGLASICFSPRVTQEELARFAQAFPTGNAHPAALAEQLKAALADTPGIRINEIRFVAEDAGLAEAKATAQVTARTLGADTARVKEWLNDPQNLLQLIAAAEGSKEGSERASGSGGSGQGGSGSKAAGPGAAALGGVAGPAPREGDILGVMRLLNRISQAGGQTAAAAPAGPGQEQLSSLSQGAQDTLRQALAGLAAQASPDRPNEPMLLRLAEHMAIRSALDRYERGEVPAGGVRAVLDRMAQEIESLRKILGAPEEKTARASLHGESHADILERQFWAAVPDSGKRSALLSPEAWCIPPRIVRQCAEELLGRGEQELLHDILLHYTSCINHEEPDARRMAAAGLNELAELYAGGDGRALVVAIRQAGAQLSLERDAELQSLVSAAFVRLTQEAAKRRRYAAVEQALGSLDGMENQRPAFAQSMRPRIGVENRLPEFIEEALQTERIPAGLPELMRLMLRPAMDHVTARLNRCGQRQDCERLVELARELGPDGVAYLREQLRVGAGAGAAETLALLSRLEPAALEEWLPKRLCDWQRSAQDRAVRLLAGCGAAERGRLLLMVLELLDPLIMPLTLDEIGMSGDASVATDLVRLAESQPAGAAGAFLRLKAFEALGRLRVRAAISPLRRVAETRQVWRWTHPSELRIVAVQALEKIDPAWAREFIPRSGLGEPELAAPLAPLDPPGDPRWVRQRRYLRFRLAHPLAAATTNLRDTCHLEIRALSLSGGLAGFDRQVVPGTLMALKLGTGLRSFRAQTIVRDSRAHGLGFEFVEMDLEDRAKLRRLLASELSSPSITSATS